MASVRSRTASGLTPRRIDAKPRRVHVKPFRGDAGRLGDDVNPLRVDAESLGGDVKLLRTDAEGFFRGLSGRTLNTQRSTLNTQHSTLNAQHSFPSPRTPVIKNRFGRSPTTGLTKHM